MDLTLVSHKTVAKVLVMVQAASQTAVTSVLFVRTDGEHRNATATQTTSLFDNSHLAHYPRPVAVRFDQDGCFVSRERSRGWTSLQIPQLDKHIINLETWRGQSKL